MIQLKAPILIENPPVLFWLQQPFKSIDSTRRRPAICRLQWERITRRSPARRPQRPRTQTPASPPAFPNTSTSPRRRWRRTRTKMAMPSGSGTTKAFRSSCRPATSWRAADPRTARCWHALAWRSRMYSVYFDVCTYQEAMGYLSVA